MQIYGLAREWHPLLENARLVVHVLPTERGRGRACGAILPAEVESRLIASDVIYSAVFYYSLRV